MIESIDQQISYTLHVVKSEEAANFGRVGACAYRLVGSNGFFRECVTDPNNPICLSQNLDPCLEGVIDALCLVADGSIIHIFSRSQHHHGKFEGNGQYRGTFNTTPEEREARGYTSGKTFIANVEQVKEIDRLLKVRRLRISGTHWKKEQDKALYATLYQQAHDAMQKASMIVDGLKPPGDY